MASRIASFVGTVQLRLKIEQATSTDDDPTPIYLMDAVTKDIGGNGKNIADAVDIIQQRLSHRNPIVKQKSLKLVKHFAQYGSPELKRALARHSTAVRDLTHFKCAPDPFKGDIPWKRVQEYAKEALEALHTESKPSLSGSNGSSYNTNTNSSGQILGGRIQGFGSDANTSTSSSPYHAKQKMTGFGSDSISTSSRGALEPSPRQPTSPSVLHSFGTSVKGFTDRALGSLNTPNHNLMDSTGDDDFDGYQFPDTAAFQNTESSHVRGVNPSTDKHQYNTGAPPSSAGLHPTGIQHGPNTRSAVVTREQRLVDKICAPSGLRISPTMDELRVFVEGVDALDGMHVASSLHKKMERGSWQETLRALCALEALLEKSTSASAGEVALHFQSAPEIIRRARQSTQATVCQRAERVLKLLGDETLPVSGAASASLAAHTHGGVLDLLGDDVAIIETSPAAAPPTTVTATAAIPVIDTNAYQKSNPIDLLAGLDVRPSLPLVGSAKGTAATSTAADVNPANMTMHNPMDALFDSMPHSSTPAQNQTIKGSDPFGDWSSPAILSSGAPSTAHGTTSNNNNNNNNNSKNILDALSDISLSSAPPLQYQQQHQQQQQDPFVHFMPAAIQRMPSLGMNNNQGDGITAGGCVDVLGALHAATSGIVSTKREDAAFGFVTGTMEQLKKK